MSNMFDSGVKDTTASNNKLGGYNKDTFKNYIQAGDIVISHHLPTYASVAKQFAGDSLNPAFATENFELIEATKPAMWIHGHTHTPCDYMLGATRVICNPKGYYDENFYFTRDGYV
jgi:Icc-related predicted phosphoesterase